MQVRSRHHLRADAAETVLQTVMEQTGVAIDADAVEKVEFTDHARAIISIDGHPDLAMYGEEPFLTVSGANRYHPDRHIVTVDAGAVSFVANGADIMRPGIVEADPTIAAGDLVCVREETHGKVLAVGRALTDGASMPGDSGRVVETIHHVGDDLYALEL
ncbi:UNVERIFIED_CONTAM: RNA-binding protein [Euhalothece sp. KZN 001]